MELYQQKSAKLLLCTAIGLCLLLAGLYGALSESELLALAFYGVLIGAGLCMLVYAVVLWRRSE